MLRASRFTFHFFAVFLLCAPLHAAPCNPSALPQGFELKRGINLSGGWQDDQQRRPAPGDIRVLKRLGFDFVRLPLDPAYLEENDSPENFAELRCDLSALLEGGLNVVLDLHSSDAVSRQLEHATPEEALNRLSRLWQRLIPVLEALPPRYISLELVNEPDFENHGNWWRLQGALIQRLRGDFPENRFVASASPHGGLWNLIQFQPYADRNVLYDFHFYAPMIFTHYGAPWLENAGGPRQPGGILYPSGEVNENQAEDIRQYNEQGWSRNTLAGQLGKVIAWKKKYKVAVACLEFGVYRPYADPGSRARWISDVRGLLETAGIPWAMWEYKGGFGLMADGAPEEGPDEGIVKALGLKQTHADPTP